MLKNVLLMFSSMSFMVSGLTFRSLIHLELIFVYSVYRENVLLSVLGLKELVLLKCPYYPKQSADSICIPIKMPMTFFTELEEIIKNLYGTTKEPCHQSNLEKEEDP